MNKYKITITAASQDKTFGSVILNISLGGSTVSYPKEWGIDVTPLREGPCHEFLFKLPNTDEELRFCLKNRCINEGSREIEIGKAFENSKETYLM